jgi:hypothetical protein
MEDGEQMAGKHYSMYLLFTHAAQSMYRTYRPKYISIFSAMDLVEIILVVFTQYFSEKSVSSLNIHNLRKTFSLANTTVSKLHSNDSLDSRPEIR